MTRRVVWSIAITWAVVVLPVRTFQSAQPTLPAWLVGCWAGDLKSSRVEERWADTGVGTLMGVGITVSGGRLKAFEFLRIVIEGSTVVYLAQPGGAPPTRFAGTSTGSADVTFENPQHDFPKRIGYRRTGDQLLAWIDGGPGGSRQEFPMRRVRCEP